MVRNRKGRESKKIEFKNSWKLKLFTLRSIFSDVLSATVVDVTRTGEYGIHLAAGNSVALQAVRYPRFCRMSFTLALPCWLLLCFGLLNLCSLNPRVFPLRVGRSDTYEIHWINGNRFSLSRSPRCHPSPIVCTISSPFISSLSCNGSTLHRRIALT